MPSDNTTHESNLPNLLNCFLERSADQSRKRRERMQRTIEVLKSLVRESFEEGWRDGLTMGRRDSAYYSILESDESIVDWNDSSAKAQLERLMASLPKEGE